ncbi:MAG: flagellar motor switch protein FliN [Planctomycetota bacterium]
MTDQKPDPEAVSDSSSPGGGDVAPDAIAEEAIEAASRAADALQANVKSTTETGQPSPLPVPDLEGAAGQHDPAGLDMLGDVDMHVTVELGRTRMYLDDVLRLNEHSIVELDRAAGDPVDVYVNDRLVARGEVLVLDDNFCVRVSEIVQSVSAEE